MVSHPKEALRAIQRLLVHGRWLAHQGMQGQPFQGQVLFEFFDHAEYLPVLMLEPQDRSQVFTDYLQMICETYDCLFIHAKYSKTGSQQ